MTIAVICLTAVILALITERVHLAHRLSDRIRVAAPPKQAQAPAEDKTVREIRQAS